MCCRRRPSTPPLGPCQRLKSRQAMHSEAFASEETITRHYCTSVPWHRTLQVDVDQVWTHDMDREGMRLQLAARSSQVSEADHTPT